LLQLLFALFDEMKRNYSLLKDLFNHTTQFGFSFSLKGKDDPSLHLSLLRDAFNIFKQALDSSKADIAIVHKPPDIELPNRAYMLRDSFKDAVLACPHQLRQDKLLV
jgi:hypothetical protein